MLLLGVSLIITAFFVNISGNKIIGKSSFVVAIIKIGGISIFANGGLWAAGFSLDQVVPNSSLADNSITDYLGALALSILTYKGFTTIISSGRDEIVDSNKNVGRAIIVSLMICTIVYLLVAFPLATGVLYPFVLSPEVAALSMSCSTLIVAVNALMLKFIKLEGIHTLDKKPA